MKLRHLLAALAVLGASATPAAAHPHMFVDAWSELVFDETGRLVAVRTRMRMDELTSLFTLEDNGVDDIDRPLTDAEQAKIAEGMVDGLGFYEYFTDLEIDGAHQTFSGASVSDVRIEGVQLIATLELQLETPQPLTQRDVVLSLYDPTYFAAIDVMEAPVFSAPAAGCRSELTKFEPTSLDAADIEILSALSREETPDDPRIGARFADRSRILCSD